MTPGFVGFEIFEMVLVALIVINLLLHEGRDKGHGIFHRFLVAIGAAGIGAAACVIGTPIVIVHAAVAEDGPEPDLKHDIQNPKTRDFFGFQNLGYIPKKYHQNQQNFSKFWQKFSSKFS